IDLLLDRELEMANLAASGREGISLKSIKSNSFFSIELFFGGSKLSNLLIDFLLVQYICLFYYIGKQ
ncbi:MAG: hypothetical protein DRP84_05175, partial [Spirochaetes bacterium]